MYFTYKSYFMLQMIIPLFLFSSFIFWSHSKLTFIAAIIGTIRVIAIGIDIHKQGQWNKVNFQPDQRTQSNAHFAGFITYWGTIVALFVGVFLINKSIVSISYLNLIGYTILFGFIVRWIIRDYLNESG